MGDRTNQSLFDRACEVIPGGVNSPVRAFGAVGGTPYFVDRAEGAHVWDVENTRYIDMVQSYGAVILGHGHPVVVDAVSTAAADGTSYGAPTEREVLLAEEVCARVPSVERLRMVSSGTEATMSAMRVARGFTGRRKVVKFAGNYHGHSDALLVSGGTAMATLGIPGSAGVTEHAVADTVVAPYNVVPELDEDVACVMVEPVAANMGLIGPVPGFLEGLRDACDQVGALLVFDEVITGFRLALGGAREFYNLQPDLSVYAKAMAGGFCLSGVGGRKEIFEVLDNGRTIHAGTYNGNPVNLAAGIATIKTLSAPGTFERMHAHGRALRERIESAAAARGIEVVTTGSGPVFSVHFGLTAPPRDYRDTLAASAEHSAAFRLGLLHRGVLVLPDSRWYVGAVHGEPELAIALAAIDGAILGM